MATATAATRPLANAYTAGKLPPWAPWTILAVCWAVFSAVFAILAASGATKDFNIVGALFFGTVLFDIAIYTTSLLVEGSRKTKDRLVTSLVATAFIVALLPLISLGWTVITQGLERFDPVFFSESMRNVIGAGGGALHAIVGTLLITLMAALISVPIGLLTSIYLVEYGRGTLARGITFFVDVMTGIPSIVAGLFAYALFALIFGPAIRNGFIGSVALSVLMIPVVVRSSEEILQIVPNELREASLALGVPKWLTVLKVVLPTSIAGLVTGVMLAVARVIGETAPLLIVAGFTTSTNYDLSNDRMMTLPVFVYTQYTQAAGLHAQDSIDRAWAGALTLILIVMLLNLAGRVAAKAFSPQRGR
ncbi:phosphate ABC transporter permease [Leifsonia xyli subsp. xyli]|uniref:Phosphate transport system permease protein PstA n=2 Tax=Leifsonia xyli subsp. xyli TaxID=59736 RepID=Q6ADG5_LEIXX|nr:phosphate ABC transporter permease PstA [Leifsonia xyli]AAT89581.1 ABC transporter, permease protein [Leifsonia xyli subsp. xyli str. CTCB07]ODA91306.1 phosphate ABC transporter permease [Leifsonia xyli subsp. xyli]